MNCTTSNAHLRAMFLRCLNARYTHAGDSADYAFELSGTSLYILFEWSDGMRDWKNNLDFPIRAYKSGDSCWFAHRGFLRVWKSVREEIEKRVCCLAESGLIESVTCIGYSHGAALAGLATEDISFLLGDKLDVCGYGFGCPRFTWGMLPSNVKSRFSNFFIIRNVPDLITHLPPFILGYRNAGNLVKIGKKSKSSPISAHYPDSYLKALQ